MVRSTDSSISSLSSSHTPSSENTATASMVAHTKKMDKKAAVSKRIVVLKISPSKLSAFRDAETVPPSAADSNESASNSPRNSSPLAIGATPQIGSPTGSDATSVQTATGVAGLGKPGPKRGRQPGAPGLKPGRKKQKLDNGVPPTLGVPSITGPHKLGPKANQGAINAQLRALDRTGKPCKRWEKTGFVLKSFTGFQWALPTWGTPATEKKSDAASHAAASTSAPSTSAPSPASNPINRPLIDIASNVL